MSTNQSLFDAWRDGRGASMIATKDARQFYFLGTDDLAELPCYKFGGGIGCGPPMKCYRHEDLVEASLEKLGRDGVTKKLVARRKREENKRRKEEQAALARQRMAAGNSANAGNGTAAAASAGNTSGGGEDSKEIKKLRSSLLRMAKKSMGFERSGAPSNWRFEVPGTSGATFAALMGRPGDVGLDTFVKNGAYYAERCGPMRLFGLKEESQLEKKFKREMVGQRIGSQVVVRYKESTMELSVSGYAEICDGGFSFGGW